MSAVYCVDTALSTYPGAHWTAYSTFTEFAWAEEDARHELGRSNSPVRAARITIVDPAHGLIVLAVWEVYADRGAIIQWNP